MVRVEVYTDYRGGSGSPWHGLHAPQYNNPLPPITSLRAPAHTAHLSQLLVAAIRLLESHLQVY